MHIQLRSLVTESGSLESHTAWNEWLSADRKSKEFELDLFKIEDATGYLKRGTAQPNWKMSAHRVRLSKLQLDAYSWSAIENILKSLKPIFLELLDFSFANGW